MRVAASRVMNRFHPILFRLTAASTKRGASKNAVSCSTYRLSIGIGSAPLATITGRSFSSSSDERHQKKGSGLDSLHIPVMRDEVLKLWIPDQHQHGDKADDSSGGDKSRPIHLIDGTVGLGGHTIAAMESNTTSNSNVRVLGIDRDETVLARAKKRTKAAENVDDTHVAFHHGSFSDISPNLLEQHSFPSKVDGILIDLGMCSVQVDNSERGFTFRKHGPLDMRFDTSRPKSGKAIKARDIINNWPASDVALIFQNYADEPYAVEIATGIIQWRKSLPRGSEIRSTLELRYIIEEVMEEIVAKNNVLKDKKNKKPKKLGKKNTFDQFRMIWHPPPRNRPPLAKKKKEKLQAQYEERKIRHANHVMRCFQALRIEVNNELDHIQSFFERGVASKCLKIGGRLAVIAFHPGEDKLVKDAMDGMVATGEFKLLTPEEEGMRPTVEEVKINGRSRTARLRAVERIH